MPKLHVKIRHVICEALCIKEKGISLQWRLFAFFLFFLTIVALGELLILFASGVFSAGLNETRVWMENELGHIANGVSSDFGKLSVSGVALSEKLSGYLEDQLKQYNLKPADLEAHSEILTNLLSGAFDYLQAALEKNYSSGAFLMLDATINPSLPDAQHSRAGLYLKNVEPNIVSLSSPTISYLRGPISVIREKGIYLLPQWRMEIKITPGDMFETVINTANSSRLPLSRLYYWNGRFTLEGSYEQNMFLCVPLIAKDGTSMGVCGFDVSTMLFKLQYMPDNTTYTRVFSVLAPVTDGGFDASRALFAGNYSVTPSSMEGTLSILEGNLNKFRAADGSEYFGLCREITLYPKDSAYADKRWMLAVMMPAEDLDTYISTHNRQIVIPITLLFILGIAAAALISRRYLSPLLMAFHILKGKNGTEYAKTRIPEIDDLIEFLNMQDISQEKEKQPPKILPMPLSGMFDTFIKNIETLSPAEKTVFNLYLEGYSAKEIADILCLSINTIKTHNKRIYMKLGITSRKELMLYAEMMKKRDSIEFEK